MAFRIFQDMRGVQATYRITPNSTTMVTQTVAQDDDVIHIADAGSLSIPNFIANVWGVVTIGGERIMYRDIDLEANTISSLLRGTAGTAATVHSVNSYVYDMGRGNLLPTQFQNYVESNSFLGNGTTETYTTDIIVDDDAVVQVYVAGELQTTGYSVTTIDPVVVLFDNPPANGSEVTILVKFGVTWYAQGITPPSASNGVALQETNTIPALFLRGVN
jgi:hypothetical protein